MATTRTRQRKLERDRYERKLVRQAQRQRRRRQVQAGIGAFLALALIGAGVAWLAGVFEPGSDQDPFAEPPDLCTWLPRDPADHPDRVEVGTPPRNPPTSGIRTMAFELDAGATGAGPVQVAIDVAQDPCGTASMQHLAAQGFFDGTECHELVEGVALRCGDPSGTGLGGPSYAFWAENLPVPPAEDAAAEETGPAYPAGTVAFGDSAGENGSQFLVFYQDYSPENPVYPLLGTVTSGLETVQVIGEAGGADGQPTRPVEAVRIRTLTVTDPAEAPTQ